MSAPKLSSRNVLFRWALAGLAAFYLGLCVGGVKAADAVPRNAEAYQADLTRVARFHYGLNAPVATLAGLVHQESSWRSDAQSPVGAQGLTQFMPDTTTWIA